MSRMFGFAGMPVKKFLPIVLIVAVICAIVYVVNSDGVASNDDLQTFQDLPQPSPQVTPPDPIAQEEFLTANRYFNSGDYSKAVASYRKAANLGHAEAQNMLGICYYKGNGVTKNLKLAFDWFTKSAMQGFSIAQNNLANCYLNAWGVDKDYRHAAYWYEKAAEQGDADAQNSLGVRYYNGEGVKKNYGKAAYWFRKAAEQGHVWGECYLGECYYDGDGVRTDYEQAVHWLSKSAEQGNSRAQFKLANCYNYGNGVTRNYRTAYMWYYLADLSGHSYAKEYYRDLTKSGWFSSAKVSLLEASSARSEAQEKYNEIKRNMNNSK